MPTSWREPARPRVWFPSATPTARQKASRLWWRASPIAPARSWRRKIYPEAARPGSLFDGHGVSPGANVHPLARLEADVIVDPGAVIGPHAEIGAGAVIGPNAVIGPDVRIGRNSSIGAGATICNALIGDRVIIHPGVRIGQDGFGFAMSPRGHLKVPQVGRVIIQDDVEIGANCTIDRGANRDTDHRRGDQDR